MRKSKGRVIVSADLAVQASELLAERPQTKVSKERALQAHLMATLVQQDRTLGIPIRKMLSEVAKVARNLRGISDAERQELFQSASEQIAVGSPGHVQIHPLKLGHAWEAYLAVRDKGGTGELEGLNVWYSMPPEVQALWRAAREKLERIHDDLIAALYGTPNASPVEGVKLARDRAESNMKVLDELEASVASAYGFKSEGRPVALLTDRDKADVQSFLWGRVMGLPRTDERVWRPQLDRSGAAGTSTSKREALENASRAMTRISRLMGVKSRPRRAPSSRCPEPRLPR